MMKDDELWLKKIKERLDDYSEPLPDAGWERLEKALPTSAPMSVVGTKKKILFRRWAMTAAAVALVAVSSVSLWLLQSPVVDDVRRAAEPALAAIPDALPAPAEPDVQGEEPEFVIRRVIEQESSRQALVAQHLETEKNISEMGAQIQEKDIEVLTEKADGDDVVPSNSSSTSKGKEREVYRPSSRDKLHLPTEKKSSTKNKGWAIGMSVGNTGALAMNTMGNDMQADPSSGPMFSDKLDLPDVSNGILNIPDGQELVFEGGVPYLRKNLRQVKDIKHKQPLSFGISVRKEFGYGLSLESGLVYSLLRSDVRVSQNDESFSQTLHMLGIPLRVNWDFLSRGDWKLYLGAGGMVEKCLYAKFGSESVAEKELQWSLTANAGVQYDFTRRTALYFEPGVSYYLTETALRTARTVSPVNLSLQLGVRLTY